VQQLDAHDLASIVCTSETMRPPKGGPTLTHRHFLSNVAACVAFFPLGAPGTFRGWSKQ